MINQKVIICSAAVGFILSCIAGFAGGAGILVILLRAFVFAFLFGALGFGVSMLYSRFLNVTEPFSAPQADKAGAVQARPSGNAVDITIAGENLPSDEQEPSFQVTQAVRKYHGDSAYVKKEVSEAQQDFSSAKVSAPAAGNTESAASPRSQTVPVDADETVPLQSEPEQQVSVENSSSDSGDTGLLDIPSIESGKTELSDIPAAGYEEKNGAENNRSFSEPGNESGIDDLPDLTDLVDSAVSGESSTIEDSDFAVAESNGVKRPSSGKKELSNKNMNDSETIAKAIRTVLVNED